MAVLTLAVLTLAVPLTAYRLLNTCRPTARSRFSASRTLQRVDMVAALGDSSARQPSLPHSRPKALFSSKAAAPAPYSPLTAPFQLPLASLSKAAPETDDLHLDPHKQASERDADHGRPTRLHRRSVRQRLCGGALYRGATSDSRKGIFSNATVGPCDGENSDFFPAGTQHGQIVPLAVTEPDPCSSSRPLGGSAAGVLSGALGT